MAIKVVWCPVLRTHVTCITDLEERIVKVVCVERDDATHACRIKQTAMQGGPLSKLLARASASMLADRTVTCALG